MGVSYEKSRNKWRAVYSYAGERHDLGRFDTKLKATRALNKHRKQTIDDHKILQTTGSISEYKWDFEDMPVKAPSEIVKPTVFDRIQTLIKKGIKWLKGLLAR